MNRKVIAAIFSICAVCWCVVLAMDFVGRQRNQVLLVLHGLCAAAWIVAAAVQIWRIKAGK